MIDVATISIGSKVHYQPDHYKLENKFKNGIIKEVPESSLDSVRVVYDCDGDWNNYKNYTSNLTNVKDLYLGWKHIEIPIIEDYDE